MALVERAAMYSYVRTYERHIPAVSRPADVSFGCQNDVRGHLRKFLYEIYELQGPSERNRVVVAGTDTSDASVAFQPSQPLGRCALQELCFGACRVTTLSLELVELQGRHNKVKWRGRVHGYSLQLPGSKCSSWSVRICPAQSCRCWGMPPERSRWLPLSDWRLLAGRRPYQETW